MPGARLALLGGEPVLSEAPPFTWPVITAEDAQHVAEMAMRSELSYYGKEGELSELEDRFARYLGVRHALGTSSGTTALHSAYFGIGLEPGDEVLAPTYTFLATVMPLFVANAVPVLVDADPVTGNIDPRDIERHITARTRAIVVTHMWGNPVDLARVLAIARRHNLKVVEDCSHAHGAHYAGRPVGTLGDVAVFSLQGKKLVAAGQGGMLVTNDTEVFERAVLVGHFNVRAYQEVHEPAYRRHAGTGLGMNYRMHPLAAAIANRQLTRLEDHIRDRRANLERLSAGLDRVPGVAPPVAGPGVTRHVYYGYKPSYRPQELSGLPIEVYVAALRAEGVPIERYDTEPLHLTPIFQDATPPPLRTHGVPERFQPEGRRIRYEPGSLPGSEAYAGNLLSLPTYTAPMGDMMDAFVAAFGKVADNLDELLAYAAVNHPSNAV